jgi:hypothetical protein
MPSRTFNQLDLTNIVQGYLAGPFATNSSNNFINTNFGSFQWNGVGSDGNPIGGGTSVFFTYQKTADLDFTPLSRPIPESALITEVRTRIERVINVNADAIGGPPAPACSVTLKLTIVCSGNQLYDTDETFVGTDSVDHLWFEAVLGSEEDIINDFSDAPISVATLQATFGNPSFLITATNPGFSSGFAAGGSSTCDFGLEIRNWEIKVTWMEQYVWGIPQDPSEPINEGSTVTLTSPLPADVVLPQESVDFEDVTQVDILVPDYTVPGTFITVNVPVWTVVSARRITFIMPSWVGNLPTVVRVRLTSTQFTGTVERQIYTILFVSASGIYELVPDKTSDTLYIELEPGETIDVKIPNPFGKSGYFGK